MSHAAGNGDPIARPEDCALASKAELKTPRQDGIDLIDAMRMFWKVRSGRIDVAADRIALGLELLPQGLLREFAVGRRIPPMNAYVPQISCSLASRPQLQR